MNNQQQTCLRVLNETLVMATQLGLLDELVVYAINPATINDFCDAVNAANTLDPDAVRRSAGKDSKTLSQVQLDDLLAEIKVRGVESNTLTKQKLSDELEFLSCHIRKRMRENE